MLRLLLLLSVAANLFWWAATHGWLPVAWLPFPVDEAQREPQRLARQVRPESVTVLPPGTQVPAPAASAAPVSRCLQAGPFADEATLSDMFDTLRAAGVDDARWQRIDTPAGPVIQLPQADADLRILLQRAGGEGADVSACP